MNMLLYIVEILPRWAPSCQRHIHTVLWRNDIWGVGMEQLSGPSRGEGV